MASESEDQAYFHALEDAFIELRGAPLLLSPADWQIAVRWREKGIPTHFVVGAIREVFEKRAERGTQRRVNSLRYLRKKVEDDWRSAAELLGPTAGPSAAALEVSERLATLSRALPAGLREVEELRERVAALRGSSEAIEAALERLDGEMLARAATFLGDEERSRVARRTEKRLTVLAERLEETEMEPLRRRFEEEEIRRERGLPLLSLFSIDARPT